MSEVRVTQVVVEVMSPFATTVTTPAISSERFDAGFGTSWFIVPQLSDSGDELRSKTVKAGYVVGKVTNASIQFYGYDVNQEIDIADLEDGVRIQGATSAQSIPDTENVAQSARKPVDVKNAVVHTVRVAGDCTGENIMDRVDQISVEVAQQGARR